MVHGKGVSHGASSWNSAPKSLIWLSVQQRGRTNSAVPGVWRSRCKIEPLAGCRSRLLFGLSVIAGDGYSVDGGFEACCEVGGVESGDGLLRLALGVEDAPSVEEGLEGVMSTRAHSLAMKVLCNRELVQVSEICRERSSVCDVVMHAYSGRWMDLLVCGKGGKATHSKASI